MTIAQLRLAASLPLIPRERLTPSEWSDRHMMIPKGGSNAEPGKYRTARMPWQKAMLDDAADPEVAETIWVMAKQAPGKTQCFLNLIGYFMHQEPCGTLYVRPTLGMAKYFSQQDLTPTIDETAVLEELVKPSRSRDSGNTIYTKTYPGGALTMCGANSASSLRGPRKRAIFQDELDSYEGNQEGDPVAQADGRAETFANAVKIKATTPTIKGASRCEPIWEASDKQYWFCPCPKCGTFQTLKWRQVKFEWEDKRNTAGAVYVCENNLCNAELTDAQRIEMVMHGEWRATAPFRGVRGRHMNGLYRIIGLKTAFKSYLHEFVEGFLSAKRDGPLSLMVWQNTFLAEWYQHDAERIESTELLKRRENYTVLPEPVLLITAGIDLQGDRAEATIVGWGQDEESWGLEHRIIPGDPLRRQLWIDLDAYLTNAEWKNARGIRFKIAAASIDAGAFTDSVHLFCKSRFARRIFATKGSNQRGQPIVGRLTRGNRRKCPVWLIGTDTAKREIYGRLKISEHGPGFMHYTRAASAGFDESYFAQLTAEEVRVRYLKGFPIAEFTLPEGRRNEALDCRVGCKAALAILQPNFVALEKNIANKAPAKEDGQTSQPVDAAPQTEEIDRKPALRPHRPIRRGGWTKGWR